MIQNTARPGRSFQVRAAQRLGAAGLWGILALAMTGIGLSAGETFAGDLVVQHADFHGKLGMRFTVPLPEAERSATLKATLASDKGTTRILHERKGGLDAQAAFTFDLRTLPAATYTLTIELLTGGKPLRQAVRTWVKPYDGVPHVGIDERNNLCVDGKPFFMVAPFFIGNEAELRPWMKCINTLKGVGFIESRYPVAGWKDFLDFAQKNQKFAVGPLRGNYWPDGGALRRYQDKDGQYKSHTGLDPGKMKEFIAAGKDHPALLMWAWEDEPDIGGATGISPIEVRRWTDLNHELDAQHPVFCNFVGYGFTHLGPKNPEGNWHQQQIKQFCYMFNDGLPFPGGKGLLKEPFPRKTLVCDVWSQDYYPIEYAKEATEKGYIVSFEDMCLAMDRMSAWNAGLVPAMAYVETCDIKGRGTPAPTPEEVRLLCWANIVHGAKGISYFHYFKPTPAGNFKVMEQFLDQVTRLTPAICGSEHTGKVEIKHGGNDRIDVLAREWDGKLYLFAVNLKHAESTAAFTVERLPAGAKLEVFDENRTITASGKTFSDTFPSMGVRIYVASLQ